MKELERNRLGDRNATEVKLDSQRPTVHRLEISKSESAVNLVERFDDSPGQLLKWILRLRKVPFAASSRRWAHPST
jgi:hypothetical protein